MDSNVISEDIYEQKREKRRLDKLQKKRKRKIHSIMAIVAVAFVLLILYIISRSQCGHYVYKDSKNTEENEGVYYDTFANGYIKYSGNGIEYQKSFTNSKSEWNVGLSYSRPFLVKSDKYILIGDRGGNQAALFDKNGQVQTYTMAHPIVHLDVADNGYIATVLQGDDCSYIQVLDLKKTVVADTKASLGDTGYPVTASLSPDATHLAISFYTLDDKLLSGKTQIAVYDMGKQIQNESRNVDFVEYESTLVPKMHFYSNDELVAFGDDVAYIFDVSDGIDQKKEITFDGQIDSVFSNESYFGFACENSDSNETGYHVLLYNKKGKKISDKKIDMNYDDVFMAGDDIIATKDNQCTIIDKHGNVLYQGILEGGHIENVLPCSGWRTYEVVFNNKIVKVKLSFIGSDH